MALMAAPVLRFRDRSFLGCFWRPCGDFYELFFAALVSDDYGFEGVGSVRTFVEQLVDVEGNKDQPGSTRQRFITAWGYDGWCGVAGCSRFYERLWP
ncbi:hypothetical protein U1Q18_028944 [Sarracenia purpurea var. burkii]